MSPVKRRLLLCLLAWPVSVQAQQAPQPRDPVLSPAPPRSAWTVRITEKVPEGWQNDDSWESQTPDGSAARETKCVRSIACEKDAAIRVYRVTTRWSDGESEAEWIVGGNHVAERPGGGLYVVGAERLLAVELSVCDFPELAWIERKHFTGTKVRNGRKVFVFEEQFNRKRMTPSEARQFYFARQADPDATPEKVFQPRFPKVVAYLDAVTQLPVLFNDGTKLRTYVFRDPGHESLRPPAPIIDFLRRRQAALDARIAPPAGPSAK